MTVAAQRSLRVAGVAIPRDIRLGAIGATLLLSLVVVVLMLRVPPFIGSGADLSDPSQRQYAANIWQETQTSLALLGLVLPWLAYGLLWPGAAWGRRSLLAVTTIGVGLTLGLVLVSAQSYTALPRQVTGVVAAVHGRVLSLRGGGSYYLVLSDSELRQEQRLLTPGQSVLLWVSPRGHAGSVSPVVLGD